MFTYDVTSKLFCITLPSLVIGGNKDLLTEWDASKYISRDIPDAELLMLQPANYEGLLERHSEVNKAAGRSSGNEPR